MEVLRTPDERFNNLKEYPFKPHYTNIKTHDRTTLRIHNIDEGPKDGPILLAMHGQPVWSYLYARMIPFLVNAGIRVIAPDLPGYGKSDKPTSREDYSFQNQVDWMGEWLKENNFSNLTFKSPFINPNQFLYPKTLSSASTAATLSSWSIIVETADSITKSLSPIGSLLALKA